MMDHNQRASKVDNVMVYPPAQPKRKDPNEYDDLDELKDRELDLERKEKS